MRHTRKVLRNTMQGLTRRAIRRLARRGGVKRITNIVYEETRGVLKASLKSVVEPIVNVVKSGGRGTRKTIKVEDALFMLNASSTKTMIGKKLWGV